MEFLPAELDIIRQALEDSLSDKRKGFAMVKEHFSPRDFGIPQIEAILEKLDTNPHPI